MERSELEEIMKLVDMSVIVCIRLSVCVSYTNTQLAGTVAPSCVNFYVGGDMHSNERLLVFVIIHV